MKKRMLSVLLCTGMLAGAVAVPVCAEETVIPILITTGTNDSYEAQYGYIMDAFNEEYAGTYRIETEKLAGASEDYRSKLKMLNSSESLPAILFSIGTEPAFLDLMIENDRLVDLGPYLEEDPEWTANLIPQSIEEFKTEKGTFLEPLSGLQMSGIYYNKDLFAQAGISEFPKTWEEFFQVCDQLLEAGITPLSLHTTETAWCAMLFTTAYLSQTEAGMEFMQQQFPDSYDTPEFREAVEMMVELFQKYSTEDAVGGSYALAANHFFAGDTAMIANGPWMMQSLTDTSYAEEGFEEKVGYATYPGNAMMGSMEAFAKAVSVDHSPEVIEGAIEYLKFASRPEFVVEQAVRTGAMPVTIEIGQEEIDKMIPPMQEYTECAKNVETIFPSYQNKWDPVAQNEVFGREIPNLVNGTTTIDEFIEMLDEGAAQYKEDIE
ncbi:MAG: extracellular solute-binding protein [Candidatus Limivivens sp.]|nr:extracellular solute-binding protein [Candidatus Limivivens sp.]